MVFVTAGLVGAATVGIDFGLSLTSVGGDGSAATTIRFGEAFLTLAEIALALVLFTDAARIDLRTLRGNAQLPERLLLIGLPLTIAVGGIVGWLLLRDELLFWEAFILAAILAPKASTRTG